MKPEHFAEERAVIYGRHPVMEALKSEQDFEKIFVQQNAGEGLRQIQKTAASQGIPVIIAPRQKLDRLAEHQEHQGIVGILSSQNYSSLHDILAVSNREKIIVILDHLEDPQNLGNLLRTCDAVGVAGVVVPKRRAVGLTAGAAKASAGAIAHVPVARVPNLHHALLTLKEEGYLIIGADQSAETDFHEATYEMPLALVLGNEHKGLGFLLKNTCDRLVKIPMRGHLDSLNVATAGALILYQIMRDRKIGIKN